MQREGLSLKKRIMTGSNEIGKEEGPVKKKGKIDKENSDDLEKEEKKKDKKEKKKKRMKSVVGEVFGECKERKNEVNEGARFVRGFFFRLIEKYVSFWAVGCEKVR